MIQETHGWLTIHDVAKGIGVALSDTQAWTIGSDVAAMWEHDVGAPPLKDLRTKKKGPGSHCFALYPPSWRERIENYIRTFRTRPDPQMSLL